MAPDTDAATDAVSASSAPQPRSAGFFEVERDSASVGPRVQSSHPLAVTSDDDLSNLPDPPANWPGHGVEVPRVFQLLTDDVHGIEVIDLTASSRAPAPAPECVRELADEEPGGGDPWLAFAAAMFRDD